MAYTLYLRYPVGVLVGPLVPNPKSWEVWPDSYAHGHYDDVTMSMVASQITSLTMVYSAVYSGADQRKHQSSVSLAFVRGIHRGPVNSPHKWPVTRKMLPFDDVIMERGHMKASWHGIWSHHWPFVVGMHWPPMDSPHSGPIERNFDVLFGVCWRVELSVLWDTMALMWRHSNECGVMNSS